MPLRIALAATLIAALPLPAFPQGAGYSVRRAEPGASGLPSNPFASNYPSAPPPRSVEARGRRSVPVPTRESVPLPPGRIPR